MECFYKLQDNYYKSYILNIINKIELVEIIEQFHLIQICIIWNEKEVMISTNRLYYGSS